MIKIKLMPDYHCYPLWREDDYNFDNIDPYSLPISKILASDLIQWAKEYDATLNIEDPLNSGFENMEAELSFRNKGENLFERLKLELGNKYYITLKIII